MVTGRQKSRTARRIYVKTPGRAIKLHYRLRRPAKARCSNCEAVLAGVPNFRPYKIRRLAKTKKRPERAFGGSLCAGCARREIISRSRISSQVQ